MGAAASTRAIATPEASATARSEDGTAPSRSKLPGFSGSVGSSRSSASYGSGRKIVRKLSTGMQMAKESLPESTLGVESMGGSGSSGNLLKKQLGATHPLEYAGHVTGSGSDEDRFVIVPEIQFGKMEEDVAFICGVFDGHGTSRGDGADFAERAATKLPTWIAERYRELILEKEDGTPIKSPKRMVSKRKSFINNIKTQIPQAMTDAFDRFQVEVHDTYMKQVERQKKEAAEGTDEGRLKKRRASFVPPHLRKGLSAKLKSNGGTTATVCVMNKGRLCIGSVGDSRAVLCRFSEDANFRDEYEAVKAAATDEKGQHGAVDASEIPGVFERLHKHCEVVALTKDHNIENNEEERERVSLQKGAFVLEKHLGVDGAEGMVQVTRSLGDVPFHKNGIVTADPECMELELTVNDMFVLMASDGVWSVMEEDEAVGIVHRALFASNYRRVRGPQPNDQYIRHLSNSMRRKQHSETTLQFKDSVGENWSKALAQACNELRRVATLRAVERQTKRDDVGIVLVTFSTYWERWEVLSRGHITPMISQNRPPSGGTPIAALPEERRLDEASEAAQDAAASRKA